MTTAGEAVVTGGFEVAGEAVVDAGVGAGLGVIVVPGGPSGVTDADLDELRGEIGATLAGLGGQLHDVIGALSALAGRPRDHQHSQSQPSTLWQVTHQLGYRPQIAVFDTTGAPIAHGGIEHPVPGEITEVRFGAAFAGTAIAS